MNLVSKLLLVICLFLSSISVQAQLGIKSKREKPALSATANNLTIGGIVVTGTQFLDEELLISISGLTIGDKIKLPNDPTISKAIQNLWKQNLFANISIDIDRIQGDKAFLNIQIIERPRLSKYNFKGIRDNDAKELKDKVSLVKTRVITEAMKQNAVEAIRKFYTDKGFNNITVKVTEKPDTAFLNTAILTFIINKGQKVKINQINIFGNEHATTLKLKSQMKGSKEMARLSLYSSYNQTLLGKNENTFREYIKGKGFFSLSKTAQLMDPYLRYKVFSASKFNAKKYESDKQALIENYNSLGYRDAKIIKDTIYSANNGHINSDILLDEGKQYYFGDIYWTGNTKYTAEELNKIVGINKGDIYNDELFE